MAQTAKMPKKSGNENGYTPLNNETANAITRETTMAANSLLVLVVEVFYLGFVELAKEFGLDVEEECGNEEAAESSSINKVVVLVGSG